MDTNIEDLKHIRSMMERSTKFLSLSGLSGVMAGLFALAGAICAYIIIYKGFTVTGSTLFDLIITAVLVLILASSFGLYFSVKKAKKSGSKLWLSSTRQILKDFMVPMVTGGLFCILLIYHHNSYMLASAMLIFYGLALIYAGARTFRDIKILGACEIILGLFAGLFTQYGLLFWAWGFGIMHIIYGIVIYRKYDMTAKDKNR